MGTTYNVQPMTAWSDVEADVAIVDPPFGIEFDGKNKENYNRDEGNVVEGYVEWGEDEYRNKINTLLNVLQQNTASDANILVFSSWNNSHVVQECCQDADASLENKLYWSYNFAPYCSRRPAHNVYEIFWLAKGDWYYDNECSLDHCQEGEANLSHFDINRDYHKDMPKYPTRLPQKVIELLLYHFSQPGDVVFDPCAGSGMVGAVAQHHSRSAVVGDINKEGKNVFNEIVGTIE